MASIISSRPKTDWRIEKGIRVKAESKARECFRCFSLLREFLAFVDSSFREPKVHLNLASLFTRDLSKEFQVLRQSFISALSFLPCKESGPATSAYERIRSRCGRATTRREGTVRTTARAYARLRRKIRPRLV